MGALGSNGVCVWIDSRKKADRFRSMAFRFFRRIRVSRISAHAGHAVPLFLLISKQSSPWRGRASVPGGHEPLWFSSSLEERRLNKVWPYIPAVNCRPSARRPLAGPAGVLRNCGFERTLAAQRITTDAGGRIRVLVLSCLPAGPRRTVLWRPRFLGRFPDSGRCEAWARRDERSRCGAGKTPDQSQICIKSCCG